MFNQYFGNYLLEKRIITPEQLRIVLEELNSLKVKLGVLAIDSGYMNAHQVNKVHKMQAARDKRFGELAIEEGYLTEEKLAELLKTQGKSNILLGQALIDKGYFTYEKYETILRQYHEDSGFNEDEIKALKSNDVEKIVNIFFRSVDNVNTVLYHDYFELFIRNLIRFIDNNFRITEAKEIYSYEFEYFVMQKMEGKHNIITGFTGSENTLARFASIYADGECRVMDALAKDSLSEFLNCQNGLFLSNLSHQGIDMELCPPEVKEKGILKPINKMYMVRCFLSFGEIVFIFSDEFVIYA